MTLNSKYSWCKIFLAVPYWPLLLILFLASLLTVLPLRVLVRVGLGLGCLLRICKPSLKKVAGVNIELCYPAMEGSQKKRMLKNNISELGVAIVETLYVWFGNVKKISREQLHIEGESYWHQALAQNKGILLLSCHTGSLDLNVTLINFLDRNNRKFAFTYRRPSNRVVDRFLQHIRCPFADHFFGVDNLLGVCRALKNKDIVWYAPDIETKRKGAIFSSFMGVPAMTSTAIGRLAESTDALVLPYTHWRSREGSYHLRFLPPLANFPVGDVEADTLCVNNTIAELIEAKPEAYLWSIKRFRCRPEGSPSVYL